MRYEPATKERALPWTTRAGIALQRPVSSLRVGDCGEAASSRQTAELDIWEDEGGTTLGRVPEHPGRQVGRQVEQHCEEFSG